MAKLTSPVLSVIFTELGITAITRGDKGTVALIVRDAADTAPFAITQASQTPDKLGKETQNYIKRTFLGYVNPPKKVIVYVLGEEAALAAALDYKESGNELSRVSLDKAREQHAALKAELSGVNAQISTNQKTYKEYLETVRKGGLSGPGSGAGGDSSGMDLSSVWGGLGIGQQLSALATQASSALFDSALGSGVGGIASDALSSAITGASLGTAIAPGIGTAIGGAIGAALGAASGAMEEWGSQDDALKSYYGGLYDDVKGRSGEIVESGSTLASGRETNRISFKTLFGSEQVADQHLEDLIDMANYTPFLYGDLVSMSKTLATYGYSAQAGSDDYILDALQTIGDAGAALGMGTSDMSAVAQALGRMKSSDKTTLEYLNMLNDRGIGAVGMLADAKEVSQGDMYKMISDGKISGTEAVDIITAALKDAYSGSMEEQARTFDGLSSTLEGLQENLNALGGEGYNALGGSLGEAIGEINAIMGENQARRENLEDQYMREVLDMVLNGNQGSLWEKFDEEQQGKLTEMSQQYAELKAQYDASGGTDWEAGAELEKLYEVAQTMGQSYFDSSDEIARLNEIEIDEIQIIRENSAGLLDAALNIYKQTQELSKGLGGGISNRLAETFGGLSAEQIEDGQLELAAAVRGSSHAFGLDRVPYDGYPALLHQGERVLTASEARAQDAGQGAAPIQIPITGNTFLGLPEEVADQIAEIIVRRLEREAIAAAPK